MKTLKPILNLLIETAGAFVAVVFYAAISLSLGAITIAALSYSYTG